MKSILTTTLALSALLIVPAFGAATKVKMQSLPAAVQKTVKEQTKNATVLGIIKETENGKTVYEVESKVNGRGRDFIVDAAGALLEVEEEVSLDSIPAGAKAAIEKKSAGGKITKVETLAKGKTVTYEASVAIKGRTSTISVAADGSEVK